MTDREVYPTVWVTLAGSTAAFVIWKYVLREPTISSCWIYQNWHIYCPACGGTRAFIALAQGHILRSFRCHPAFLIAVTMTVAYMVSQTIWRLRGKHGWVLHYSVRWPQFLAGILIANCLLRNLLLVFGVEV